LAIRTSAVLERIRFRVLPAALTVLDGPRAAQAFVNG